MGDMPSADQQLQLAMQRRAGHHKRVRRIRTHQQPAASTSDLRRERKPHANARCAISKSSADQLSRRPAARASQPARMVSGICATPGASVTSGSVRRARRSITTSVGSRKTPASANCLRQLLTERTRGIDLRHATVPLLSPQRRAVLMKELEPDLSLGGDQVLIRHRRMLEAIDAGVDGLGCAGGAQVADRRQAVFLGPRDDRLCELGRDLRVDFDAPGASGGDLVDGCLRRFR